MKLTITYIFHNCFTLQLGDHCFLFDYPDRKFLKPKMRQEVIARVKDSSLFALTSHSHPDHFNPQVNELISYTKEATFIFANETTTAFPVLQDLKTSLIVEPEHSYQTKYFNLETLESNDLGVAFLIQFAAFNIYFGGDLANWNWDELDRVEREQMEVFYHKSLAKLKKWPIDIAFVNTDRRLKNWAGAGEFISQIKPKIFIPMHTFGKTRTIDLFVKEVALTNPTNTTIWRYFNSGDTYTVDLPDDIL